jgi:PTH1 family peptidyl-tRNA hydrolase
MILIVGLGNPGEKYAKTRHNFGFMVADALVANADESFVRRDKWRAEVAELKVTGRADKVIIAKPQTFMNLSGEAVTALMQFYKLEPKDLWVIADDLDLPLGKIRVRHGGETGGHHGLESIVAMVDSKEFNRIRLGIRGQEARDMHLDNQIDTTVFVTSNFADQEWLVAQRVIQSTIGIIKEGIEAGELKAHSYELDGFDAHAGDNIVE